MPQRDFVIVGILQRHFITAQVGKHIIASVFPGTGGIEHIRQFINEGGFTAGLPAEHRHSAHKEGFDLCRNIVPVAERRLTDLPPADIHKGTFRVDKHCFDAERFTVTRHIRFLT